MKKLIVPLAIVMMLLLLGAAAAWDCVRLAADGHRRVALADQEMQKHELRLVKLLSGSSASSPEVRLAIAAYESADRLPSRHAMYDELIVSFRRQGVAEIDPTNPLDRKFMDDVAGAINRREIAEKQYNQEMAAYQSFLNGRRGSVARLFSSHARDQWQRLP